LVFICLLIIMHSNITQIQDNNNKKTKGPYRLLQQYKLPGYLYFYPKEQR